LLDSLINIGESAFGACQSLESVEIPNSMTFIGSSAFWGCTKLASFSFPLSVTSIEYNTFKNSGLTTVKIPSSIFSIKPYAFSDCNKLSTVSISPSVTFIGDKAFNNCNNLISAYFYGNAPVMGANVFGIDNENFRVYYLADKTGYENPWHTYTTATFENIAVEELTLNKTETTIITGSSEQLTATFVPENSGFEGVSMVDEIFDLVNFLALIQWLVTNFPGRADAENCGSPVEARANRAAIGPSRSTLAR